MDSEYFLEIYFMVRYFLIFTFLITFLSIPFLSGNTISVSGSVTAGLSTQDTLKESQILFNGRAWRNRYYRVKEDQFLFSNEFLPGSVTIEGNSFGDVILRYDIYSDEVMIVNNHGAVLQMNKEMVDSFNFTYQDKQYYFVNLQNDSLKGFRGYMNILYKGKTSLYVKYKKEIELLAVDKKYDRFYESHKVFFVKDDIIYLLSGKREFLKLLQDHKSEIRSFIKKNRLKLSKKVPESFLPVLKLYDSLSN
jgi:hypothetical protein